MWDDKNTWNCLIIVFCNAELSFLSNGKKMPKMANGDYQWLKYFVIFFLKKSCDNVWSVTEKYLPLHPQSRGTPWGCEKKEFFEKFFHTDK